MMKRIHIWKGDNVVELLSRDVLSDDIIKIDTIGNIIYALTSAFELCYGNVEWNADGAYELRLSKSDIQAIDITCDSHHVYIVERSGRVIKYSRDLKCRSEIVFGGEKRCCLHGHREGGMRLNIVSVSANDRVRLFVTDDGQLWAAGNVPQLGVDCLDPKRVTFFDGKVVCTVALGDDFAVAVVRKLSKFPVDDRETDSDECSEDVFVRTCPRCTSNLSSSVSQMSVSGKSNDDDEVSSDSASPAGRRNGHCDRSTSTDTTSDSSKRILYGSEQERPDVTSEPFENGATTSESTDSETTEKKNIIFRNTEAAREFLTRQFSWMSAGEEYLYERTEGPTESIRRNVSNVANLVYEGVRTVGDKVATLSRHVSGGSDTNEPTDIPAHPLSDGADAIASTVLISADVSDDLPWSSSAGTSERDTSEKIALDRADALIGFGSALLQTEVWTWGNERRGQLGVGDTIGRAVPVQISKLFGLGVQKVVCGAQHAAALTLDGRAFLWGRNDSGQASTDSDVDRSGPKRFDTNDDDRIRDVACGSNDTLLCTYGSILYVTGASIEKNARPCRTTFEKLDVATLGKSRVLSANKINCYIEGLSDMTSISFLLSEQKFLESCTLVNTTIVRQFQKKSVTFVSIEADVYDTMCRCYSDVLNFSSTNVHRLTRLVDGESSDFEVPSIANVGEQIVVYRAYLDSLCDVVSLGGFAHISRLVDVPSQVVNIFSERPASKKLRKNSESIVSLIFRHPLSRLESYKIVLDAYIASRRGRRPLSNETDGLAERKLVDSISKWDRFLEEREKKIKDAETTKCFWEGSGRVLETLRSPERRLIRESKTHPIVYLNGSRFSTHWFVLLTDLFVHLNGTSQTAHALQTVWVESLADTESLQNALSLTMPEENMILYATSPCDKNEWLSALRDAIKSSLKKSSSAMNPPLVRNACYTFIKNGYFKDAKYSGRWSNGKMHGAGKLEWPDGKTYCGQFQNNQLYGHGRMDMPDIGVYEGRWRDNVQNGAGIMRYASGDIYEGHFKDGLPHGHGVLKHGHFMAQAASVYVGEWVAGLKCGYGVMDDISKGEKYLGNWHDDKKSGGGLIVTLDGIYYEGEFSQDVMTGRGLMIFEDGTRYEGEFRAVGVLNGKGALTLNSGDRIEGSLSGSWNEGIKINNATLHTKACSSRIDSETPASFGKLCVAATEKWKAIFRQCYRVLGVVDGMKIDETATRKAWQNVAVLISGSRRNDVVGTVAPLSSDDLDTIPEFGREQLTVESLREIERYLSKAFSRTCHPLGTLLVEVIGAYTATYGGVRVHPLLLNHAVAELRSITDRMYEVVTLLFPALPPPGKEFIFEEDNCESVFVNATSLLHPALLPRVHSALFVLYALHNKTEDDAYWKRLVKWNRRTDDTLMTFLCVDRKFRTRHSETTNPELTTDARSIEIEPVYADAIESLQQLKTTFSPFEKLLVIRETFRKMTACVRDDLNGPYLWTMDDLFPMFLFVVIRARILQLGSEIHFVEDFMEPSVQNGELGIMFTTLKACYYQILREKISMCN